MAWNRAGATVTPPCVSRRSEVVVPRYTRTRRRRSGASRVARLVTDRAARPTDRRRRTHARPPARAAVAAAAPPVVAALTAPARLVPPRRRRRLRDRDRVSHAPGSWRVLGVPRCIASTRPSRAVPGSTSPTTCVTSPPRAHCTRRLAPAPPRCRRRRNRRRRRRGVPIGNRGSESGRYPRPRRAVSSGKYRSS